MPQASIIKLDLRKVDDWNADDNEGSSASAYYQQKENPPRVGWTINTIPTLEGVRSSNLFDRSEAGKFPPVSNNQSNLFNIDTLIDVHGNLTYLYVDGTLEPSTTYTAYALNPQGGSWAVLNSPIATANFQHQRHTLFQNRTLMMLGSASDNTGFLSRAGDTTSTNAFYDIDLTTATATLYNVTGTSLAQTEKNGITSWGNYVILWNASTLFWSDPNVFSEFTVGGSSLAGSQKISEARGNIITIVPNALGFTVYCQDNVIQASYSGDSSNPWIFTEVTGGGGLLLLDGMPLVTRSENTSVQVAYTTKGLQVISTEEARPMPPAISDFVLQSYIDTKEVGTSKVIRENLSPVVDKKPKLKNLYLSANKLFLTVGAAEEYIVTGFDQEKYGRLYVFDMQTGTIGMVSGDIISVAPEIEIVEFSANPDLHNRNRIYAESYVLCRRIKFNENTQFLRSQVLDLGGHSDQPVTDDAWVQRDAEIFLGNINLKPDKTSELIEVKLFGDTSLVPQSEGGDDATRAKVFVYSEYFPENAPKEFKYNARTDSYVGFAIGAELQVEIRGKYFYLTDIHLSVQAGGDI